MSFRNNRNHNAFSWAGQPTPGPNSQQWTEGYDASTQPMGPAEFLSTETPRNPQSMIQDFNAELPYCSEPQNVGFGQSPRLNISGAHSDCADLPFDLAIGSFENNDLDAGAPGPSSCGLARTVSQGSSNGIDEVESTLSMGDDLYDTSFGDGIFNTINSPAATSVSDVILSRNTSLENSPVVSRCPWLSAHIDSNTSGDALGIAATAPQPSAAHINNGFSTGGSVFANIPRSVPGQNISALSTGLSNQQNGFSPSPTSEYFDHWSIHVADETESLGQATWGDLTASDSLFLSSQNQFGPSLVIHPPEASDLQMDDFQAPDISTTSRMHPIDHITPSLSTFERPSLQSFLDARMPTPPVMQTTNRLAVPPYGLPSRPRLPSDPARPSGGIGSRRMTRTDPRMSRTNPSRSINASPAIRPGRFQRPSTETNARSSGVAVPVPIASTSRRPTTTAGPSASTNPAARPGPARGRRRGPMDLVSRGQAKEVRNKRMVCIRCKHSKQACKRCDDSPDSPCSQCERHGSSNKWPGPCVKAHFEDIVLSGSLNYMSQRAICHRTLDGTRRIRKELPKEFPLDSVLAILDRVRGEFNFRVYQDGKPVYILDLDACYEYLSNVRQQAGDTAHSRQSFIDHDIVRIDSKNDEWEDCMTSLTLPEDHPLALLSALTSMPSRARFSYVFKHANLGMAHERFLDPENPDEADNLMLAAQLARVMCRKVEVRGYGHLQRALHKSDSLEEDEILLLLQRLGRVLLTLRWRSAWWRLTLDDDDNDYDQQAAAREPFETRVRALARVLYFYYCSVRRKLPAWSNVDALRGVLSRYPDTEAQVWDDFPGLENVDAFEAWMRRGEALVYEAGAPRVLASTGFGRRDLWMVYTQ